MSQSATVVPSGYHTVNPYLTVNDVPALIQFLEKTFGGVTTEEIRQPDGRLAHTEVRIGDTLLMVGAPQIDAPMPPYAEPRPGTFYVYVADVDATYHRAMTCGASSYEVPTERFYGDRTAAVTDDNGNVWWIATKHHAYSERELQKRADQQWRDGNSSG